MKMTSSGDRMTVAIPWPWITVDGVVGSMLTGRLIVIAARPSNGKTTALVNLLDHIYEDAGEALRVLCCWTERSPEIAYATWASLRLGLDEDAVTRNAWDELPEGSEMRVRTEMALLKQADRYRFLPLTLPGWKQIEDAVTEFRPHVLIWDYLQRIRPGGYESKWQALSQAALALQTLAVEANCAVIVGSQLKRRGDAIFDLYRPPNLEDCRGAGEIEEAADVILGLFRPLKPITAKEEQALRRGDLSVSDFAVANTMAVKVVKHRWRGDAADKIVRLTLEKKRLKTYGVVAPLPPRDAGDAYEGNPWD